ncbi:hypothetical protein [Psychroflexus aestuariivivens]|uniref:hypothetical protein n=1 Tax=Psychroflexus aestuariivivens TaxID=1795040 RepID=UPI000FD80F7B|nr:hypothetical protein [Psychroflexus aestuariivivens]
MKNFKPIDILYRFKIIALLFIIAICLSSCGAKSIPQDAVFLYEDQLEFMDGYYAIEPYQNFGQSNYLSLEEFFNMKIPIFVEYLEFEFQDEETLRVSYEFENETFDKIIKGKHKKGAFYLEKKHRFIGIPLIFWTQKKYGKRVMMGKDDNLVIDIYDENNFGIIEFIRLSQEDYEIHFYNRLYENVQLPPKDKKNSLDN